MLERLAALDSDVLLLLQHGVYKSCTEAYELLKKHGFLFRATPTVIQELERHKDDHRRENTQALAQGLLAPGVLQGLQVVTARLDDAALEVAEIRIKALMEDEVLADPERGDMAALVEAAYSHCDLFITMNQEVLDEAGPITLALLKICGRKTTFIASPEQIIEAWD